MGETFGRYQVLKRIGRGGMAEVFRARFSPAPGVNKDVVLKRILPAYADLPEFREMFLAEARLSMRLSHGNLVQVFDAGEVDDALFLAMEFVDGVSLEGMMQRAKERGLIGLPPVVAGLIITEVLKGLHHAHTRKDEQGRPLGLVHRDVSPDNVLVSFDGEVKVTDFGIAKAALAGRELTRPGIFKGKFTYGAPEQARGEAIDARADVYATGIVLYELINGSNPSGPTDVAKEVGAGSRSLPRFPVQLADPEFVTVISRAIAPLPQDRYANAQMFQQALMQWTAARAGVHAATGVAHTMRWLFTDELQARNPGMQLGADTEAFVDLMASRIHRQPSAPGGTALPSAESPTNAGLPAFASLAEPTPAAPPAPVLTAAEGMTIREVAGIGVALSIVLVGAAVWMWTQERSETVDAREQLEAAMKKPIAPIPEAVLRPRVDDAHVDAGTWEAPPPPVFAVHGAPADFRLTESHLLFVDGAAFVDWAPGAKLKVLALPRNGTWNLGPMFAMQRVGEVGVLTRLEPGKAEALAGQKGSVQVFVATSALGAANAQPAKVDVSGKVMVLPKSAVQVVNKDRCVTVDGLVARKSYLLAVSVAAGARVMPVLVLPDVDGRIRVDGVPGAAVLNGGEHLISGAEKIRLVVPTMTGIKRDDVLVKLTATDDSGPAASAAKPKKGGGASAGAAQISSQVAEARPHFDRAMKAMAGGKTADARDALVKGLKLDPRNAAGHYWAGVMAQRSGDTTDALFQFRLFLKVAPDDHPSRQEVAGLIASLEQGR